LKNIYQKHSKNIVPSGLHKIVQMGLLIHEVLIVQSGITAINTFCIIILPFWTNSSTHFLRYIVRKRIINSSRPTVSSLPSQTLHAYNPSNFHLPCKHSLSNSLSIHKSIVNLLFCIRSMSLNIYNFNIC